MKQSDTSPALDDVTSRLRQLLPVRPLSWDEARAVAERQAAVMLDLAGVTEPPVPADVISSLPNLSVDVRNNWPVSGTAVCLGSQWRIVLRGGESRQRQRFTLGHEYKHLLDDSAVGRIHAHLAPGQQASREEILCDYFAACLMMPRPWIKHDFYGGIQRPNELAQRYDVSAEAMSRRLDELGLLPRRQRVPRTRRPT